MSDHDLFARYGQYRRDMSRFEFTEVVDVDGNPFVVTARGSQHAAALVSAAIAAGIARRQRKAHA